MKVLSEEYLRDKLATITRGKHEMDGAIQLLQVMLAELEQEQHNDTAMTAAEPAASATPEPAS